MIKRKCAVLVAGGLLLLACTEKTPEKMSIHDIATYAYLNPREQSDSIYLLDEYGGMSMYLSAYINNYYEQPASIDFLIKAFDKREDADEMKGIYAFQYRLLKRYRNDLILYTTDSLTAIFYKKLTPSNVVAATGYTEPDYDEMGKMQSCYSYYDEDGYVLYYEEFTKLIKNELTQIIRRYDQWQTYDTVTEYEYPFKIVTLAYIPSQGLVNLDTKHPVSVEGSAYFTELERWMKRKCEEHGFSKLVIASPTPKDAAL